MAVKIINGEASMPEEIKIDEKEALAEIAEQIRQSREYVKPLRVEFRSRMKLYNNQRKQKDKVGDTSLFNVITTMLAIYYSDEMQVSFQGREIGDASAASDVENTAKFDYDEMEMDIINFQNQFDRLFFGVGIRQCSEWNAETKTPMPKNISALCWLPDPKAGLDIKKFRWSGFEVEYTRDELTEEAGFFNIDNLPNTVDRSGTERDLDKAAYNEAAGLGNPDYKNTVDPNSKVYNMIDLFTVLTDINGTRHKYLVTVDDNCKNFYRLERLEPITPEEKKNPIRVPFPLSLNYYMPQAENPFGTSICDLVEDKQRAKSIFKNLRIAAEKALIYPMYLYNRDKILNRRDLDFAFNKFIAVRGDVGNNVVVPLNKGVSRTGDVLANEQSLDNDIEISTGASKNSQGVMSEQQRTLGEQEIVQANANLRYLLGSKINAWGERRFWKLWYRLYKQNFPGTDKKIIRIKSAIGNQYATITRRIFITKNDPDIFIGSKLEVEQKRQRDSLSFESIVPMFITDPSIPLSSRNFIKRHLLRLKGVANEVIAIMVPDTPDEYKAKMENELLNKNNNEPEIDVKEDHLSHIVIHSQAEKTPATMGHINAHYTAYYETEQYQKDREAQQQYLLGNSGKAVGASAGAAANANANLITNNNSRSAGVMPAATA